MSDRAGTFVCDLYQTDLPTLRRSHPYAPPRAWVRPPADESQAWTYVFRLMRGGHPIYHGHPRNPAAYVKILTHHPELHPGRPIALDLARYRRSDTPVLLELLAALWANPDEYPACVERIQLSRGNSTPHTALPPLLEFCNP